MRVRLFLVGGVQSEHVFDARGGTFGRSLKCDWVLPDEERILSAIHGRITYENNRFMLTDESTNGIFLDGRQEPIGRGNTVALGSGLKFRAARHLIEAAILPAQVAVGFNTAPPPPVSQNHQPLLRATSPSAEQALGERGDLGDVWGRSPQDPLVYLNTGAWPETAPATPSVAVLSVPYIDPVPPVTSGPATAFTNPPAGKNQIHPATTAGPFIPDHAIPVPDQRPVLPAENLTPPAAPSAAAAPLKLIPDDFDPLSILFAPPRRAPKTRRDFQTGVLPGASPQPSSAPTPEGAMQQIPSTFNISPQPHPPTPAPRELLSPSLMANMAPLGAPAAQRSTGGVQPQQDFDAIEAMKARREERKARLLEKANDAGEFGGLPGGTFAPSPASEKALMPRPPEALMPMASVISEGPVATRQSLPAAPAGAETALKALFDGMGLQGAGISPDRQMQLMQEVGEMVRAFSEGLILLLSARRMVKSEFRMDETQVQPEENNPFKHFKMAELALDELFVTRSGGFQSPGEAAASALEDLKQHVMLSMAAMQRAIKLLMERLSPENAARDDEAEGAYRIRGLGARKGKWETYVETHQRMSGNFDGVTRQLIAEAFAQVQEEQARKIASEYWENKK